MTRKRKSAPIDLNALAALVGVGDPARGARRLPRGSLGAQFWRDQFALVVERVEAWGYEVELRSRAQDCVELADRLIIISTSAHPETRFYTLLHEVGHILIRRRWKEFTAAHPRYLEHPDLAPSGTRARSRAYRVGLVHEELQAWARGLAWARRLGFFVDPVKFDSDKNSAIMSYLDWAVRPPVPKAPPGATPVLSPGAPR